MVPQIKALEWRQRGAGAGQSCGSRSGERLQIGAAADTRLTSCSVECVMSLEKASSRSKVLNYKYKEKLSRTKILTR